MVKEQWTRVLMVGSSDLGSSGGGRGMSGLMKIAAD